MSQPDLIITPFGENATPGTIDPIPESRGPLDPAQKATWESGFPSVTMMPLAAGGLPPRGQDINGVLNAISEHTVFQGGGGQYKWSQEWVDAHGGYPKGAVLQSDDGAAAYVSTIENNSVNFNTTPSSVGNEWARYSGDLFPNAQSATPGNGGLLVDNQKTGTGLERVLTESDFVNMGEPLRPRPMELIAHRGFRNQAPQNTLIAFSTALKRGAASLECDVQISSDGVLYCFHDLTVDALTDGVGTFTALSSAYIDNLKFTALAGTAFADTKITRFSEFLACAAEAGCLIYPEIKAVRTTADISLLLQAVADFGLSERCTFQSFQLSDLQHLRTLDSSIAVGLLGGSSDPLVYNQAILDVKALGGVGYLLWDYSYLLATPDIVAQAKFNGVGIGAWTVNSAQAARELMRLGVSKIMSDISLQSGH